MRNEVVLKKTGMGVVKMATHSGFEKGYAYKSTHISAVTYPRLLNLIQNLSLDI